MGINKNNAIVFSGDVNRSNSFLTTQTWNELDLSAYTSNKLGKCLLYFEVVGINDDGTEIVSCDLRPKGATNIQPISVSTRYCSDNQNPETTRDKIGVVECWTDDDGFIEWRSNYEQWFESPDPNKTVTLQIKIMLNIN
jgi:hypothetical protein